MHNPTDRIRHTTAFVTPVVGTIKPIADLFNFIANDPDYTIIFNCFSMHWCCTHIQYYKQQFSSDHETVKIVTVNFHVVHLVQEVAISSYILVL